MARFTPPLLPGPSVPPPPRKRPSRRLCLPRWLIGLLVVSALPAFALAAGAFLLAMGHTELLAQIIVGCVLLVVFGTPTLCLFGFIALCFWLIARAGRSRRPASRIRDDVMYED